MKVSIVTVVRNGKETIERAIQSVIGQTYPNIEYIIIDGASTDGTQKVIEKYRNSLAYYISEPDHGIYDAMNKGILHASGDIIGFLNSDDWYEKNAVEKIVTEFTDDYDVVSGQVFYIGENGVERISIRHEIEEVREIMPVVHPATFVRTSSIKKVGMFDDKYRIAGDYDLIYKIYNSGSRFKILDAAIVNFSIGGISTIAFIKTVLESNEIRLKYAREDERDLIISRNNQELEMAYMNELLSNHKEVVQEYLTHCLGTQFEVFGCGYWGQQIYACYQNAENSIERFWDNDERKWDVLFHNIKIECPEKMKSGKHSVLVAIWDYESILNQIENYKNEEVTYVTLKDMLRDLQKIIL